MGRIELFIKGLSSVFSLFFSRNQALAQWGGYRNWHMGPGNMGGWGIGWFGGIFALVFWALLIVGLVFLIKWLSQISKGHTEVRHTGSRALEILSERYARGEIGKEEYEQKKRDLTV